MALCLSRSFGQTIESFRGFIFNQSDYQVCCGSLVLLVSFAFVPKLGASTHTGFNNNSLYKLFPPLSHSVSIECQSLSLIHHQLDSPVIELKQGAWYLNMNILRGVSARSKAAPESRAEHGSL